MSEVGVYTYSPWWLWVERRNDIGYGGKLLAAKWSEFQEALGSLRSFVIREGGSNGATLCVTDSGKFEAVLTVMKRVYQGVEYVAPVKVDVVAIADPRLTELLTLL